ncbi:MAG: GGDEF domain-containing protein [Rubrivivax sp.]|nr:MAG: GGDEF domain-containing protein [Rubrivivax sp.]
MSAAARPPGHLDEDPLLDGVGKLVAVLFGPDRVTRSRTAAVLLCALMYGICCWAAFYVSDMGMIRPFAPRLLLITTIPMYAVLYALIRSGRTRHLRDPALMIPQNIFALLAISFAYTALGPTDRGIVLVLIALVMVFGMYTHTPKQSVQVGVAAMLLLGASMGVLAHLDPDYYPPRLELIRFELMLGTLPPLIYTAYQISTWRNKLVTQRRELKAALEQVQQLATHDSLTGLFNRRHMQERLENAVMRFDRYGERFTIVLIDLDHFKQVNDRHGHRVGDESLSAFATAALGVLRDTDTIARWGGEEFLVLMPNTSREKTLVALERLRVAMADCTLSASVPTLRITFSAGVAVHESVTALSQTVERADQALYEAKHTGRNRVMVAPAPSR